MQIWDRIRLVPETGAKQNTVLFQALSVTVTVKTASEMTYTVSDGALNSTQSNLFQARNWRACD